MLNKIKNTNWLVFTIILIFLVCLLLFAFIYNDFEYVKQACNDLGYESFGAGHGFNYTASCGAPINSDLPITKPIKCNFFIKKCF